MFVIINFNMCDNSPECSGATICPTGAISWNENQENALGEKGTLIVQSDKCISCGLCIGDEGCPVGAISLNETNGMSSENTVDIEKLKSLFVERYGAEPIDEFACIKDLSEIQKFDDDIIVVEEFSDSSIQCLLHSIPAALIIQEIELVTKISNVTYVKRHVDSDNSNDLPNLSVYKKGKKIAKVVGYYDDSNQVELLTKISEQLR